MFVEPLGALPGRPDSAAHVARIADVVPVRLVVPAAAVGAGAEPTEAITKWVRQLQNGVVLIEFSLPD